MDCGLMGDSAAGRQAWRTCQLTNSPSGVMCGRAVSFVGQETLECPKSRDYGVAGADCAVGNLVGVEGQNERRRKWGWPFGGSRALSSSDGVFSSSCEDGDGGKGGVTRPVSRHSCSP
jgi:hypothetical protein